MIALGPYELVELVAEGGMAEVWRAVYEPTDTQLAVKVSKVVHPSFVAALHGEAAVMASFRSPYIAAVHDFGVVTERQASASHDRLPADAAWLAVEWVPHGTIAPAFVFDWWMLRRILLDVAFGLAHAHAHGVLHRDVKPENLLVAARSPLRVKLADFGIAFARERWLADASPPSQALTPRWSAPEQVESTLAAQGPWTDLYLLGLVAWHLWTGELPYAGITGSRALMDAQVNEHPGDASPRFDAPAGFEQWLARAVAKRPRDRFHTAPEAIDALLGLDRVNRLHRRHWSTEADPEAPPPRGPDDPGPGVFANRRAPLVGREAERDLLWNRVYDVTVDRTPRAVLIHGPSGIGTTALARWLVERTLETGIGTAAATTTEEDQPLAALVAHHLGGSIRRTTDLLPSLSVHFPDRSADGMIELARWLSGQGTPDRALRFSLAARVFARRGATVIVWVEGFAEGELAAFARWVGATRAFPALFVFTEADERLRREPALPTLALDRVPLYPLTPETMVRLVQSYGAVDQTTAVRIADRSAGFPRLAEEMLRGLAATKALRPSSTGWRASRSAALDLGEEAVSERRADELCKLVPRSLPTLTIAAVLGMEGTVAEWEEVAKRARILIPSALVPMLLRQRVLGPRGSSYAFTQPTLLDALARRTADRHPALHHLTAEVLEARGADAARIGRHWYHAGEVELAREWLQKGLAHGLGLVSQGVCLDLLERIVPVDSPERGPLLFLRIERARVSGRVDAALDAIRKLLQLARRHSQPTLGARALMQRAVLRVEGGDDEGAIRDAREAARLANDAEDPDGHTRQVQDWLGLVLGRTGHMDEARRVLTGRSTYLAHYGLGMISLDERRPDEAQRWFESARVIVGEDPLNVALLENAVAEAHREQGRLDTAERLARAALDRLADMQTPYAGDARICLGYTHLLQGRWAAAEVVLRPALADNDDVRRAAIAGLALATARQRRDPTNWLQWFDPRGLRMSVSMDRAVARVLDDVASSPDLTAPARVLAEQHASVVAARARSS